MRMKALLKPDGGAGLDLRLSRLACRSNDSRRRLRY